MKTDLTKEISDDWDPNEYANHAQSVPTLRPPFMQELAPPITPARVANTPTTNPAARPESKSPSRAVPHKNRPRNFPGFIARSSMFRVSASGGDFSSPTLVRAQGCTLILTGPKLSMRDKHVWETAIQIAKERAPSIADAFEIELRDFARRLGSTNQCGTALSSIWESLERLASARVEFQIGDSCKGIGSLLASAFRDDGKLYLRLNPDFAIPALLGDKQFLFDQARRSGLPTSLAQWLHDFFSTHKEAREMDLRYLRELCGYDGTPRNFPGKLRIALDELVKAAPTLVASFEIDRSSRSSDNWKLRVVLGSDSPAFLPAERIESPKRNGRGRVAL